MSDISTIARANAISVEAKLVRHSKRTDGGINIGLAIHPHGIPQALIDAQLGDRFMVALVQIDEHEQPIQRTDASAPVEGDAPGPSTLAVVQTASASANGRGQPSPARKPVDPERRLTQRAAILCGDGLFQKYLNEHSPLGCGPCIDKDDAKRIVCEICQVKSRKDIIPGTVAATRWDFLESSFVCWRDKDSFVEVS